MTTNLQQYNLILIDNIGLISRKQAIGYGFLVVGNRRNID